MSSKGKAKRRKSRDSSEGEEEATPSETIDFKALKRNGALKHDFERLCTSGLILSSKTKESGESFIRPEMFDHVKAKEFDINYFEKNGLTKPILFKCKPDELGMMMPDPDKFCEDDVLELIGPKRYVEVVVVDEQSGRLVPLEVMIDYYKNPEGRELTNMLSLEFSLTKMRDVVSGPAIVNDLDWVGQYFPDELCTRSTNFNFNSNYSFVVNYPAVQRFCLMSTPGCYTDFHLDFGGTSVWYHVLHGKKVFFLIEPTEQNLLMYDQWQRNYDMSGWFGDIVEKCARMEINPGETAILPSGWIHAVYTPVKSLVFGGNYLHTYSAAMQCKVQNMESKLRIAAKYRYPFFEELHFFLVAKIVEECTGRQYVRPTSRTQVLEYVGKEWIADGGHRIPISWDHYNKLMADRKRSQQSGDQNGTNIPTAFPSGSLIFFDPPLEIKPRKKSHKHKWRISVEPEIGFIEEGMKKITPRLLAGYESILAFLWSKKCVDLPDQISRPASLLYCFEAVLFQRRTQLAAAGEKLLKPRHSYSSLAPRHPENGAVGGSSTASEAETVDSSRSEEFGFEGTNSNDRLISMETELDNQSNSTSEEINPSTSSEIKEETMSENGDELISKQVKDNDKKDVKAEEETDLKNETNDSEEKAKNGDATKDEEMPGEEKKRKRGRPKKVPAKDSPKSPISPQKPKKIVASNEKKANKRKSGKERLSFEDALNPPKPKKKHDPKKDKPEFVGGIPVAPIQSKVVPNAYNYDPMQEITKLGTGQLQSTYRKSLFTIAPPKQKKIFKLEHKNSTDKDESFNSDPEQNNDQLPENHEKGFPQYSGEPLMHDMNSMPRYSGAPFAQESMRNNYSPTVMIPEDRRFSTGSMDRPEYGIRDRTLSLDSSVHNDFVESPNSRPRPTTSWRSANSPSIPRSRQQYTSETFIQRARELMEQMDDLHRK